MNTFQKISLLMLGLALTACVKPNNSSLDSRVFASKPDNYPVEIVEKKNTNRAYKVVGTINAPVGRDQSAFKAIERLKMMARNMGGDALLDLREESVSGSAELFTGGVRYRSRSVFLSTKVIVWQ